MAKKTIEEEAKKETKKKKDNKYVHEVEIKIEGEQWEKAIDA